MAVDAADEEAVAWGAWWNRQGGDPLFDPQRIAWSADPPWSQSPALEQNLAESDRQFMEMVSR